MDMSTGLQSAQPVLVTGATGFIGGRLVRRLIEDDYSVSCLVRHSSQASALRTAGARVIAGDVTDPGRLKIALEESKPAVVFHLAGLVKARSAKEFMLVNAGGVEKMAAACARCVHPPVFIIVSSLAAAGPSALDVPRTESDPTAPVSDYGRSKLAGEEAAAKYADFVPTTIVRPPVVFGPGDRAVLEVFRSISSWGVHVIPGRRAVGVRDMRLSVIYVDDLVDALCLAAASGERMSGRSANVAGGGIYFVASEEQPTYPEFGLAIALAFGRKPPTMLRVPSPFLRLGGLGGDIMTLLGRKPGLISRDKVTEALAGSWMCSPAKASAQLGWSPGATLVKRLRDTIQWYREAGWL